MGLLRQRDLQRSVLGGDRGGVIPLQVSRLPVVKVDGFPIRIIAGVERSSGVFELVRRDQLQYRPVVEGCFCQCPIWSIWVDGTSAAQKFGDLNRSQRCPPGYLTASESHNTRGIGSAIVEIIVKKQSMHCEVGYYEVSSTVGPPRRARQGVTSARISEKKHTRE